MKYQKFEDLPVWNTALELAEKTFNTCGDKSFAYYGDLRRQMERAALSVSNNIAEGFERRTTRELIAFLYIARGSSGEVRSMLHLLERDSRFDHLKSQRAELMALVRSTGKQLNAWIESLEKRKASGTSAASH